MPRRPQHKYEPPDGWHLCVHCGLPEGGALHYATVPTGWEPIETAPKWRGEQEYLLPDGTTAIGHWAQDLSGEAQPPFKGFFTKAGRDCYGTVMREIHPVAWRERLAETVD